MPTEATATKYGGAALKTQDDEDDLENVDKSTDKSEQEIGESVRSAKSCDVIFLELFAGTGKLSKAVKACGVQVLEPEDAAAGGVNFERVVDVTRLKDRLRKIAADGCQLVIHQAPPCYH